MTREITLDTLIAPSFFDVHAAIRSHAYTHYWLCGGRGSTKSSFASIQVVLAVARGTNAVVIRKVADTLRHSVYPQLLWALRMTGYDRDFHPTLSPLGFVHKSGRQILLRGMDDPGKLKSLKFADGHAGIVWYEETDQFAGMREIRNVNQSLLRGDKHTVLYTYNPPRHRAAWVNVEEGIERPDRLVHRSCYTDVDPTWLGPVFLAEAEQLKASDEKSYRHEYLGEAVGVGGVVFDNLEVRTITPEERDTFERTYSGLDWGFDPDPLVYERMYYDRKASTLYIFDEFHANRMSNEEAATHVKPLCGHDVVWCDSAEPKSIQDFRNCGIDARKVRKRKGGWHMAAKWFQTRKRIVIDPKTCPVAAREFPAYEYVRTKDGEYTSAYPDKEDHGIAAAFYGANALIFLNE